MHNKSKQSKSRSDPDAPRFWRIPEGDSELLVAKYAEQAFGRHAHDRYALGVIVDGAEKLYYRGTHWYGSTGSVVSITPGEIHDGIPASQEGWTYRMMYVDPAWLNASGLCGNSSPSHIHLFHEPFRHAPQLAQVLLHAHKTIENACSSLERETALSDALERMFACPDVPTLHETSQERNSVRKVREKLIEEFDRNITLAELGLLANMDPLYLIRVFRREIGASPHSYQLQERVARAQRLLRTGINAADAALMCGFTDQSHMHRTFKKIVGITPGKFKLGKTCGRYKK
jgi:AraC-like DNA-binding protein